MDYFATQKALGRVALQSRVRELAAKSHTVSVVAASRRQSHSVLGAGFVDSKNVIARPRSTRITAPQKPVNRSAMWPEYRNDRWRR